MDKLKYPHTRNGINNSKRRHMHEWKGQFCRLSHSLLLIISPSHTHIVHSAALSHTRVRLCVYEPLFGALARPSRSKKDQASEAGARGRGLNAGALWPPSTQVHIQKIHIYPIMALMWLNQVEQDLCGGLGSGPWSDRWERGLVRVRPKVEF